MASKTRIFRTDVKLDGNTIVAAWDPHNRFGDVSVKDVFLSKLSDVDFNGRKMRNLVIPKAGWATVYKTEDGYYAVDADAELDVKRSSINVEEILDSWDDLLLSKGYSYVGDNGEEMSERDIVVYSKPRDKVMPIVILHKGKLEEAAKTGKLKNYVCALTICHDMILGSKQGIRKDFSYRRAGGDLKKALDVIIDAYEDMGNNYILWQDYYGKDLRNPEVIFKTLYDECDYHIKNPLK